MTTALGIVTVLAGLAVSAVFIQAQTIRVLRGKHQAARARHADAVLGDPSPFVLSDTDRAKWDGLIAEATSESGWVDPPDAPTN